MRHELKILLLADVLTLVDVVIDCCSLQTSVDQWRELECDLGTLESWISPVFDRISSAGDISTVTSADQLSAQMKLLLVCWLPPFCLFVISFSVYTLKHFLQLDL